MNNLFKAQPEASHRPAAEARKVLTEGQLNRRRGGAMRQFRCMYECWKVAVEVAKEQTIQLHYT